MSYKVAADRATIILTEQTLLKRLDGAADHLIKLNPQNEEVIKALRERVSEEGPTDDLLTEIVNFVLAAEKGGSIHEMQTQAEKIREEARKTKEKAWELKYKVDDMKESLKKLREVLNLSVTNTEHIRKLLEESEDPGKN